MKIVLIRQYREGIVHLIMSHEMKLLMNTLLAYSYQFKLESL